MDRSLDIVKTELLLLVKKFHAFCINNDIYYSIHGGTMLGAVREKGFIPWDDDIDVTFIREEYLKFEKAYNEKSMAGIKLSTTGFYPKLIMKRDNRPAVWMDIFIYDYITDNPIFRKYKIARLKIFNLMFRDQGSLKFTKQNSRGNWLRYLFVSMLVNYGNHTNREKLQRRAYRVMLSFPGNKNWLCRTNDTIVGMPKIVPGYAMDKYELIQFEDTELMISSYWDEILTVSYGKDYMTPRITTDDQIHNAFIEKEIEYAEIDLKKIKD